MATIAPLKIAIFNELSKGDSEIAATSHDELNKKLFKQYDSLRLTLAGYIAIKKVFTAYSFELPYTLKARHQIGMSRMVYPYFLTAKRLILFSEMDSVMIKLHGSIEGFLENCYQLA